MSGISCSTLPGAPTGWGKTSPEQVMEMSEAKGLTDTFKASALWESLQHLAGRNTDGRQAEFASSLDIKEQPINREIQGQLEAVAGLVAQIQILDAIIENLKQSTTKTDINQQLVSQLETVNPQLAKKLQENKTQLETEHVGLEMVLPAIHELKEQVRTEALETLAALPWERKTNERAERFTTEEALAYAKGCDFAGERGATCDYHLTAWQLKQMLEKAFHQLSETNQKNFRQWLSTKTVVDGLAGPGALGRVLANEVETVIIHDGDSVMINWAKKAAAGKINGALIKDQAPFRNIVTALCDVRELAKHWEEENLPTPDVVTIFNSLHQLPTIVEIITILNVLEILSTEGFLFIQDFKRCSSNDKTFLNAILDRCLTTKPEIVPLLLPSLLAAHAQSEWEQIFSWVNRFLAATNAGFQIEWSIETAMIPTDLSPEQKRIIEEDPVVGHRLDRQEKLPNGTIRPGLQQAILIRKKASS